MDCCKVILGRKSMATKPTLDEMNLEELKALSREIEKAIRKTATENLKKARDAAEAAATQFGLSLEEVVERRPVARTKSSEANYRNHENFTQTWSGRGRQPQWFKDAIAGGRVPEDLAA
jgi:DNA-binding protein H-NS